MSDMNNTDNSPFTNGIGIFLVLLASAGVAAKWFWPDAFHGQWSEITVIGVAGLVLIFGMGDDFLRDIRKKFQRKDA